MSPGGIPKRSGSPAMKRGSRFPFLSLPALPDNPRLSRQFPALPTSPSRLANWSLAPCQIGLAPCQIGPRPLPNVSALPNRFPYTRRAGRLQGRAGGVYVTKTAKLVDLMTRDVVFEPFSLCLVPLKPAVMLFFVPLMRRFCLTKYTIGAEKQIVAAWTGQN